MKQLLKTKERLIIKKFVITLIVCLLIMSTVVFANNSIRILVNGREISPFPSAQVIDDRIFVPLRFVSEALGAEVSWNAESRTASIQSRILSNSQALELITAVMASSTKRLSEPAPSLDNIPAARVNLTARRNAVFSSLNTVFQAVNGYSYESMEAYWAITALHEFLMLEQGMHGAILTSLDAAEQHDFNTVRNVLSEYRDPELINYLTNRQKATQELLARRVAATR